MNTISDRANRLLSTAQYAFPNAPEVVARGVQLQPPEERQYILRCPLLIPGHKLTVPSEMDWAGEFIDRGLQYQHDVVKVNHPYVYLTVRHGLVTSQTDDEFHVDGFSMRVPHGPEQNYVWTSNNPTEYVVAGMEIPEDFDPLQHNLQHFLQDSLPADTPIHQMEAETIYAMDPYILHRRPNKIGVGAVRTFLRLTCPPIPIDDRNNHINPSFGDITSDYDGVKDFRDKLERYSVPAMSSH